MLKQIKTLGLALIVGMLVGCEDIESTEIQETENVKQEQQVEKEIKTKEDRIEQLEDISYQAVKSIVDEAGKDAIDQQFIFNMIKVTEDASEDPYGYGLSQEEGRTAIITGISKAVKLDKSIEEILAAYESLNKPVIENKQEDKNKKKVETKNEEPKTETKESELSKSLKGKSRNTKIRTIISQALETATADVDWEEAYLKEYKETNIELSEFINTVVDKSIVAMMESVDSIPELAELEPTEKEIAETVSTYFTAEFSTLNTKNLMYRMVQIDEAKKIEEWENSDWNKEAEEIVPTIEHEEARDLMEKYASEHFGCTVYVADISLEEELYSGIMYATSDYRLSLGYIHVNCVSGELDEITEDVNAASKLEAVN